MTAFTLPDTLPVVVDLEALPGVCARLTLADGEEVMVTPSDRASLTLPTPDDLGLLIRWNQGPDASRLYRVPAAMAGRMAWATGCRPTLTPTLTAVHHAPDAVTFTATRGGSDMPDVLTVPRGALVRLGLPLPRLAGQSVTLTITDQGEDLAEDPRPRVFFFEVYPETPEGAACLEALGLSERVGLPDGEE